MDAAKWMFVFLPGVLLVDTMGELAGLFRLGNAVFMGGTFPHRGGHNPLEPAAFGVTVVAGPHMENFATESRVLLEKGGGMQVNSINELVSQIGKLLDDGALRNDIGVKAFDAVQSQKGAVDKTVNIINSKLEVRQA